MAENKMWKAAGMLQEGRKQAVEGCLKKDKYQR